MKTKRGVLVILLVALVLVCALGMCRVEGFKAAAESSNKLAKESHISDPHPVMPKSSTDTGGNKVAITGNTIIISGQERQPFTSKSCDLATNTCGYTLANGITVYVQNGILTGTTSGAVTPASTPSSSSNQTGAKPSSSASATNSTLCPNGEPSTTGCCPSGEPKGDYPCCPDGSRSRKGKCAR